MFWIQFRVPNQYILPFSENKRSMQGQRSLKAIALACKRRCKLPSVVHLVRTPTLCICRVRMESASGVVLGGLESMAVRSKTNQDSDLTNDDVLFKYVPDETIRYKISDAVFQEDLLKGGDVCFSSLDAFDTLCNATEKSLSKYATLHENALETAQLLVENETRSAQIYLRTLDAEKKKMALCAKEVGDVATQILDDGKTIVEIGEALRRSLSGRDRLLLARLAASVWQACLHGQPLAPIFETRKYRQKGYGEVVELAKVLLPAAQREKISRENYQSLLKTFQGFVAEIELLFKRAEEVASALDTKKMASCARWHRELCRELGGINSSLHSAFIARSLQPIRLVLGEQNFAMEPEVALSQVYAAAKAIITSRAYTIQRVFHDNEEERIAVEQMLSTHLFTKQGCSIATALHEVLGAPITWGDGEKDEGFTTEQKSFALEKKLDLLTWAYSETLSMSKSLEIDPTYVSRAVEALFTPYRKMYAEKEREWLELALQCAGSDEEELYRGIRQQVNQSLSNTGPSEIPPNPFLNVFDRSSRRCFALLEGLDCGETFFALYTVLSEHFESTVFARGAGVGDDVGDCDTLGVEDEMERWVPESQSAAQLIELHYLRKVLPVARDRCDPTVVIKLGQLKRTLLYHAEERINTFFRHYLSQFTKRIASTFQATADYSLFASEGTKTCSSVCKLLTRNDMTLESILDDQNLRNMRVLCAFRFFGSLVEHILSLSFSPIEGQQLKWDVQLYEKHLGKILPLKYLNLSSSPQHNTGVQTFDQLRRLVDVLIIREDSGAKNLLMEKPLVDMDSKILDNFFKLRRKG